MTEILTNLLNSLGLAWWVEVTTSDPQCTYYFGPFPCMNVAQNHRGGYIEDLEREGARNIIAQIKRCRPTTLTICSDLEADSFAPIAGVLSSQF